MLIWNEKGRDNGESYVMSAAITQNRGYLRLK